MKQQDYHGSITASVTPQAAFEKISRVSQWWAKDFEGKSDEPNDVFTVRFKNGDWYTIKIAKLIPGKKILWDVIDAEQTWHEDRKEWAGTNIVFEISPLKNGSKVTLTHSGLTPEAECYDKCKMGWDYLMQKSLSKFLTEGIGLPA
ncbi:MAG TPA: SRPBCC domain-containing protein [Ktedonobacteraceae bacterium]|nr:SRPBCC domain-containing protein [Ktedonobacteraceae bacterium]